MKAMKRAGITAASIVEKIGITKDGFKPEDNEVECVYGPPEWFEPKPVEQNPEDDYDPSLNEIEDVYGPPEWFESDSGSYNPPENEIEGVYGPPQDLQPQKYEPRENIQPPVYGPPSR